ncbi:MAG TPA: hypothetical protein VGR51_07295 [Thermoplasmata archaeon]|jgi:hypothetical protein|nr:hypothetical protein [Thermoplasmata archaeon]
MTELHEIDFAEVRRIATQKGLQPGRVRGTEQVRFTKGSSDRVEVIDWTSFEQTVQRRNLGIYESGGWMKIMRKH